MISMIAILPDIIRIVGHTAPLLASALGTPISGVVVSMISSAIGADSKNHDDILQKLTSNSNISTILQDLEQKYMPILSGALNLSKPSSIEIMFKVNWTPIETDSLIPPPQV